MKSHGTSSASITTQNLETLSEHQSPIQAPRPRERGINWPNAVPFFVMHGIAVFGFVVTPFAWKWVALALGSYYLRMFGVTGGYHRYFAHRTFKTSRVFQFILACLAQSSAQKGALWWAAHHRHHHKYSDLPADLHSPKQDGFWWSHVGWILSAEHDATDYAAIRDFKDYPELQFLNRNPHLPAIAYAVAIFLIFGAPGLWYGFFISTAFLWHGTFTINSLSHVFGSQRYASHDTSRNNFLLALVTMGEGWHNNHHTYMSSTRQGFFWWEIDPTYYVIKVLSWFGIVWDVREPPVKMLENRRLSQT